MNDDQQIEMQLDDLERWRAKHAKALGRGKHYVEPKGYAGIPGTGPAGQKCKTCSWARRFKKWWKCGHPDARHSGCRQTDILANAPACSKWKGNE